MAKIYRQSDISEQDIFGAIGESAKKNMAYVEAIDVAIQKFTAHSKEILGKIDPSTLSGMNELVSVSDKINKQTTATINLEKEKVKLQQLNAKTESERIKTERERIKTENERAKAENDRIKSENASRRASAQTTVEYQKQNIAKREAVAKSKAIAQMQMAEVGSLQQLEAKMKLIEMAFNRLTPEQIENTKQGQRYLASLTATRAELQKQQTAYGKHSLNVGNYKSAFDGLGMSITQITREMPAFANSFQTGFMAISNNLPMFFDEIQKIKQANVDLVASGQEPVSVFKRLGASIFSLQTLLSVGVTLLTVYGAKFIDWIFNTEEAEKATKKLEERKKRLNEETKRQNDLITSESSKFVGLIYQLKATNAGSRQRINLIKQINDQYGTTLKNLRDETAFQDQLNVAVKEYILYQTLKIRVQSREEYMTKLIQKRMKLEIEHTKILKNLTKGYEAVAGAEGMYKSTSSGVITSLAQLRTSFSIEGDQLTKTERSINDIDRQLQSAGLSTFALKNQIDDLTDGGKKYVDQNNKTNNNVSDSTDFYDKLAEAVRKAKDEMKAYQELVDSTAVSEGEKAIDQAIQSQLDNIAKSGEYSFDVIDKLIQQQYDLEYAIIERTKNEDLANAESGVQTKMALIKRNNALLALDEKYGNLKRDAHKQLNDALEATDSEYVKSNQKMWEDNAKAEKDAIDDMIDKQKEFAQFRSKIISDGLDELKKASVEREKIIDQEIAQSEKLAQSLQAQAEQGTITAEKSLAEQNAITNKKMQEKQKEEQLQQKLEELKLLYQGTMQYVEKGDSITVAGGKAFLEVKGLKALAGLKGFFKGTKRTVGEELGEPVLPGRDGHVIRVDGKEKILNPDQSMLTGSATTDDIVDGFLLSKAISNGLLQPIGFGAPKTSNDDRVVNAVMDLKRVIENKTEISIEANKISQTLWEFTQSEKKGTQLIHNRYIHRKNHS